MSVDSQPLSPRADASRASRPLADKLQWGALIVLAAWAILPIVYLLVKAASQHASLSGADSEFSADQLQYLAWIRSSGDHVLAANDFDLHDGAHVYLQPMFLLSGLLWRAGVGIALSYLLWLPVAVGVLFFGFRSYVRRWLDSRLAQAAALILALFFVTPVDPLVGWTVGSNGLATLSGELAPAGALFGYFPIAITTGLLPLYMLGLERIIEPAHSGSESCFRSRRLLLTAGIGMAVSWLHPWQGETLLLVTAVMLIRARFARPSWNLLVPAVATALPLGYYFVLSRGDVAWRIAETQSAPGLPSVLLLLLALAPLLWLVPAGVRGMPWSSAGWILVTWPLAALVVYFGSTGYAAHALEGLPLPLTVLAVRGWQRLRPAAWVAMAAIAVATLPGLVFDLRAFRDAVLTNSQRPLLSTSETDALRYLASAPGPGGVLPSLSISAAVPAYTGRRTWIGHSAWTPNFAARAQADSDLFSGRLSGLAGQRFLRKVGARYILADCEPGFDPTWLGKLKVSERAFGCVKVYELAVGSHAAAL